MALNAAGLQYKYLVYVQTAIRLSTIPWEVHTPIRAGVPAGGYMALADLQGSLATMHYSAHARSIRLIFRGPAFPVSPATR
jgi:hypothetical protein